MMALAAPTVRLCYFLKVRNEAPTCFELINPMLKQLRRLAALREGGEPSELLRKTRETPSLRDLILTLPAAVLCCLTAHERDLDH